MHQEHLKDDIYAMDLSNIVLPVKSNPYLHQIKGFMCMLIKVAVNLKASLDLDNK